MPSPGLFSKSGLLSLLEAAGVPPYQIAMLDNRWNNARPAFGQGINSSTQLAITNAQNELWNGLLSILRNPGPAQPRPQTWHQQSWNAFNQADTNFAAQLAFQNEMAWLTWLQNNYRPAGPQRPVGGGGGWRVLWGSQLYWQSDASVKASNNIFKNLLNATVSGFALNMGSGISNQGPGSGGPRTPVVESPGSGPRTPVIPPPRGSSVNAPGTSVNSPVANTGATNAVNAASSTTNWVTWEIQTANNLGVTYQQMQGIAWWWRNGYTVIVRPGVGYRIPGQGPVRMQPGEFGMPPPPNMPQFTPPPRTDGLDVRRYEPFVGPLPQSPPYPNQTPVPSFESQWGGYGNDWGDDGDDNDLSAFNASIGSSSGGGGTTTIPA